MTSALLDQDFGSESEDDNFNPAPADDSDGDDKIDEKSEDLSERSVHRDLTVSKRRTATTRT